MANSKVIGGPLDKEVTNQLDIRSKVLTYGYRDNIALQYMSAKTGWVKMSSSVLVENNDDLAKKYILIGGTSGRSGSLTYSNFPEGKGTRPMPGITGVSIKSINKFGLLKEGTITYNCWDVSQLQELEILFMRPGYSVLLEWGHSLYYTTETNWQIVPMTVSNFFTPGTTKQMVYAEIEKLKKESGYNYDAIYGFIKNFSWSFRADGGYDCTTTLTSIGEIIESLQIDIDNPGLGDPPKAPAGSSESGIEGYSLGDRSNTLPNTRSDTSEKVEGEEKEKGGILFVGDSITTDNEWKNGVPVQKIAFTYANLVREYYKGNPPVDILAIGGKRMNDWMIEMLPMVLRVRTYDIVFIYGGINDAFALQPVDEMLKNCQKLVDMVNASGGKPIVILGYDAAVFMNSQYPKSYSQFKVMTKTPKPGEKFKDLKEIEMDILIDKLTKANSKVTREQVIQMRANYIEYQKQLPTKLKNCTYVTMFPISANSALDAVHPGASEHIKWRDSLIPIIDNALAQK